MQTVNQRKYNAYVEEVRTVVERKVGGSVTVQKVNKNNGLVLDGLTIMQEGVNLAPTIYLNGYYEDYLSYGAVEVAKKIITIYEANKPKESIDISFFTDIEKVRPTIKMKLINYEKNKALLVQIPYIRFLDLAVVFIATLESDCKKGFASILIHNHHMEYWNMLPDDLYKIAMENTANDFEITPMLDIINELLCTEYSDEMLDSTECRMSVLTNHYKLHGAVGMMHKEILNQYMKANQTGKIVILPSSIHEVLLISCDDSVDMEYYKKTVKEVNATQVLPEETLSDNVYVYDGNAITIAE